MKTNFAALVCSALLLSAPLAQAGDPSQGNSRIREALEPFVESHSLAGAVTLVADKQQVLSRDAVGFADVEHGTPMQTDALFWIASQSKSITATALMMLVDAGKVKLDDPVEKYLPEFHEQWLAAERAADHVLLKRPKHPITVREILSHTSGLPPKSLVEQPTLDLLPLRVGALSYVATPLDFEPGTSYRYSNAGINTAGRIIEVVSGTPYEDFLQQRLFWPLDMKDTTFWPTREQLKRLAESYKPDAMKTGLEHTTISQLKYPLDDRSRQPMPAGGLFSTADDLVRFCQMILNNGELNGRRYLSPESVREMTRRQTPESNRNSYGLGWSTHDGIWGHGGAYATNMSINSKTGLITIFLVQHQGFPGNGKQSLGAFHKAAEALFAHPQN
jgi:CubicO group peptidase (beta-lactamase class C family)